MAIKYKEIPEETLRVLCGAIKSIASRSDIVDDNNIATNSTYSSLKAQSELDKINQIVVEKKTLLAEAITNKGAITYFSDPFETMATNIRALGASSSQDVYIEAKNIVVDISTDEGKAKITSSSEASTSYAPYKVFDGSVQNAVNAWRTGANLKAGEWIQWDLGRPIFLIKLEITNSYGSNAKGVGAITKFRLEASNDGGATFDTIYNGTNTVTKSKGVHPLYLINSTVAYSVYRLVIEEGFSTSTYCAIGEIMNIGIDPMDTTIIRDISVI